MIENKTVELARDQTLLLDSGKRLGPIVTAYTTYGQLNDEKSNAVLVCHALTGDQYVASKHPITKKDGWWSNVVGPGKSIDTNKFFVVCPNVIGGCMGSSGPKEINPVSGKEFGTDFPIITIADMVKAQKLLIDHLNIKDILRNWWFYGRDACIRVVIKISRYGSFCDSNSDCYESFSSKYCIK